MSREQIVENALEIVGTVLIVVGLALWSVPVALVVAGAAVLLMAHPIRIPRRWRS
jgi:cytochrome c-type biogenesis protein CcmH/NrfF